MNSDLTTIAKEFIENDNPNTPSWTCGGERHTQLAEGFLALQAENEVLREALRGILEIGKRDMTNSKYDGYFEQARAALKPQGKGEVGK